MAAQEALEGVGDGEEEGEEGKRRGGGGGGQACGALLPAGHWPIPTGCQVTSNMASPGNPSKGLEGGCEPGPLQPSLPMSVRLQNFHSQEPPPPPSPAKTASCRRQWFPGR